LPTTLTRKFSTNIGDGTTTSIVVTHNLGTKAAVVFVTDNTTPFAQQMVEIQMTTTNTVTLVFATAPTLNQFLCTVVA
jgi:ABC-type methionine transport system permease subunit